MNISAEGFEKWTTRRRFPRYTVRKCAPAAFISDGLRIAGEVQNISLGGLFLQAEQTALVGAAGQVSVVLSKGRFRSNAVVRYVEPRRGFSLEFTNMSSSDGDALWDFCCTLRRAAESRASL